MTVRVVVELPDDVAVEAFAAFTRDSRDDKLTRKQRSARMDARCEAEWLFEQALVGAVQQ